MKLFAKSAFAATLLFSFSCGEADSEPKNSDSYIGSWGNGCEAKDEDDYSSRVFRITESSPELTITYFSDETCQSKTKTKVISYNANFGEKNDNGHNLDITMTKEETTYHTQTAVDAENNAEYADYTDWEVGKTRVEPADELRTFYTIVGLTSTGQLCVGAAPEEGAADGSSPAKRSNTLNTDCFKKR